MDEHCPHCGVRLPPVHGAFCGECREELCEPPVRQDVLHPVEPPSEEQVAFDESRAFRIAVIMAVLFYAAIIGSLLTPRTQAQAVDAFGAQPLGMPAPVFAGLLSTLLYFPMPRAFYHYSLISEQARRDGRGSPGLGIFLYVMDVDRTHPHLAESRSICLTGLCYAVCVLAAWIVYAAALGI